MHDDPLRDRIGQEITDKERLLEALDILESVYADIGPYGKEPIGGMTLSMMNVFFKFDDSE